MPSNEECECSSEALDNYLFPFDHECDWHDAGRAICYALFLLYLFIGVALFSDIFMGSIEEITSKTKKVKIDGKRVDVKVWNDTVANLSLMALGSSAPEILLSCIELIASGFKVGELGPATIVGSASFNLFMISGICTMSVDLKKIKEAGVFALTASVSLFAYAWLVFILVVTSPNRIQVWEGVFTFLFFPALLVLSYRADKHRMTPKAMASDSYQLVRQASSQLFGGKLGSNLKGPAQKDAQHRAKANRATAKVDAEDPPTPAMSGEEADSSGTAEPAEDETAGKRRWSALSAAANSSRPSEGESTASETSMNVLRMWGGMSAEQKTALKLEQMKQSYARSSVLVQAQYKRQHLANLTGAKRHNAPAQVAAAPAIAPIATGVPMNRSGTVNLDLPENAHLRNNALEQIEDRENESWAGTIKASLLVNGGEGGASPLDFILHIIAVFWKFIAALLPPAHLGSGYPCFVASIAALGAIVAIIEEVASTFSCLIGLSPSVAAITIVALGTSLPDTFASRSAAMGDQYADASVGNVTGSNSVNVFLGIGLPWMIGAIYWTIKGEDGMEVPETGLPFAVFIFLGNACISLAVFAWRRKSVGGELGGKGKHMVGLFFMLLWIVHVTLSALNAEGVIDGNIKSS